MTNEITALPDLETALKEMNTLVDKMEHSELTLEQSLLNFERGVILIKHCQKILQEAEQKVHILMQTTGQDELQVFNKDIDQETE